MNDIVKYQNRGQLSPKTFEDVKKISEMMVASGFFKDMKDAAQAAVKIYAGQEIGIGPFASMKGIQLIQGTPVISANIMASAVKGHPKYDYRVKTITDEECVVAFYQEDENIGESRFSLKDAQKAGTSNLGKFPRNMLFARALSNGVKWFCPDVFSQAVYVEGEIPQDDSPAPPKVEPQDVPFQPVKRPAAATTSEPQGISAAQVKALAAALREAGFGADDDSKEQARKFCSFLAEREPPVNSIMEFTAVEATSILGALSANRGDNVIDHEAAGNMMALWAEHEAAKQDL